MGQPRTVKVPGTCRREAGLDRALGKESGGTSRKDGQYPRVAIIEITLISFHPGARLNRTRLLTRPDASELPAGHGVALVAADVSDVKAPLASRKMPTFVQTGFRTSDRTQSLRT